MIVNLNNNVNFILSNPFRIERTAEQQSEIDINWNKFIKDKNPDDFFNGDIYLANTINKEMSHYNIEIGMSKYSDLIYAKQTEKIKVRSLFVASYIVTTDNFFCVIKNKRNRINTIGGLVDKADFINKQFMPIKCLLREWQEEMGINLNTDSFFYDVTAKYLKIPDEQENLIPLYPVGILYEIKTSLSSSELVTYFNSKKDITDGEICELLFYNKQTYPIIKQQQNAESYIYEMFHHAFNE